MRLCLCGEGNLDLRGGEPKDAAAAEKGKGRDGNRAHLIATFIISPFSFDGFP